jgi:hypothetical protein
VPEDNRVALFSSDAVLVQSEDLSVVIEELKVKGEEDREKQDVLPESQPQIALLASPLYLAKHDKRRPKIGSGNNSNV